MSGGYGKPARGGAAKKVISEASFRLAEAAERTVDNFTGFQLTKAAQHYSDN